MSPLEVAIATRELLSEESRWAKTFFAFTAEGEPVYSNDKKAVCWCLSGAINKSAPGEVNYGSRQKVGDMIEARVPKHETKNPLIAFNDNANTTHAQVLEMLDSVIKDLR